MRFANTLFLFIFSGLTLCAQVKENSIAQIRKRVNEINNAKGLIVKVLKNEEFLEQIPDGGGELKGYSKNGRLVKIVEWIGLSSCVQTTEYYLQDGKLMFVYIQGRDFEHLKPGATTKPKLVMECRFYYKNNQLVKSLMQGKTKCSDAPSAEWAKELVSLSSRYLTLLKP